MFKKIEGGSKVEVYGFKMHLPPIGKGLRERLTDDDRPTGEWVCEKTDTLKRSQLKADQYWERVPLPDGYNKKRWTEEKRQKTDDEYLDQELEKFRKQEWGRRLRGVWVYINGVPVYLTGLHYFYLNYWQLDTGYPSYRDVDRRSFYLLQYIMEDLDCLGLIEVTGRRAGKTHRSACFMYEYISRNKNTHGGIQSKTDDDAKEILTEKMVPAWKKLPHFFRPIYDTAGSDSPKNGIRFFRTASRGKNAVEDYEVGEELESWIDFGARKGSHYDGKPLHIYIRDEAGKLKDVDIVESHNIVRFCSELNRKYIGKQLYTTTVEEMMDGGGKFKDLFDTSDQNERGETNRTATGLYRVFTPSDEYEGEFDKYGITDIKANRTAILAEREMSKNNVKTYYGLIRKKPLNLGEAFKFTGADTCMYDAEVINSRLDDIEHLENIARRGNLIWKDGKLDGEVEWVSAPNGRWQMCWNFPKGGSNKGFARNGKFYSDNDARFVIGCDPFKSKITTDYRRSKGAAFVYRKPDPTDSDLTYQDAFVFKYHARPKNAPLLYEDMILTCRYFGCKILFESNVDNWIEYFTNRGYEGYLMKLPNQSDYGIYANTETKSFGNVVQEEYISIRIEKVFFIDLLKDWLKFDLNDSQKFDLSMAAMWTLVANQKVKVVEKVKSAVTLQSLIPKFKIKIRA